LQHLVFMGSSHFPGENELDDYVSSHGGGVNAFTEEEYTLYQVDVAPAALEGAYGCACEGFLRPRRVLGLAHAPTSMLTP
jgi:nardilysin